LSSDFQGEATTASIRKSIVIKGILAWSYPAPGGNHLLPITHADVITEAVKELAERIDP